MLNDKIKDLLLTKNLTPSRFADEIGVQRSSISHILSGRNRPSLEIVQKIMKRFPELGTDWLLEESVPAKNQMADRKYYPGIDKPENGAMTAGIVNNREESEKTEVDLSFLKTNRRIERILVFYTDNTFGEFLPGDTQRQQ